MSSVGGAASNEGPALDEEHIEVAVVVVVEQRRAGTDHLEHVSLPGHTIVVDETEAGFAGCVTECGRHGHAASGRLAGAQERRGRHERCR